MKKLALFLFLVIFFGILGAGVMAMTKVAEPPEPVVYVAEIEGSAFVMKDGFSEWEKLREGQELSAGDSIKTEEKGIVMINFFDNSSSRIGPNTEITFDQLKIDENNYAKTNVAVSVQVGKVWSRIIQLMDKDSSFEVGSDSTVATVRGTIFNFELSSEGIARVDNIESLVEVAVVKIKEEFDSQTGKKKKIKEVKKKINLTQGMTSQLDENAISDEIEDIAIEEIPEFLRESDWFRESIKADEKFEKELREKQESLNREMAGALPGSAMYLFKKVSEKIRLAFTQGEEEKNSLELAFAKRRLAEAFELAKRGDVEGAERLFQEYRDLVLSFEKQTIIHSLILRDMFGGEGFEHKEKINNFDLEKNKEVESETFLEDESAEEKSSEKNELDLENLEIQTEDKELPRLEEPKLENKESSVSQPEIISQESAGESNPTEPSRIEPVADPVIVEKKLERLEVACERYNISAGQSVQCKAIAYYADGSVKTVNEQAKWSLSGDIGSLSGSGLLTSSSSGGKGIVSAVYNEDGIAMSGSSREITALSISLF